MLNRNLYTWSGLGLLVAGGPVFLGGYFILQQTWLQTLGMAMIILALICLVLGRTIPRISPEVSALLLQTGTENLTRMIEELGVRSACVYLPSSLTQGKPQALIPLHTNPALPRITTPLPRRLIVRYGSHPDDVGLLVSTLGSAAISLLDSVPGDTPAEMESALTRLLSGTLGVADGTRVAYHENRIEVEIRNPRFQDDAGWCQQCLGGPMASMVATIVAEARDKPVTIKHEERRGDKCLIELEVLA